MNFIPKLFSMNQVIPSQRPSIPSPRSAVFRSTFAACAVLCVVSTTLAQAPKAMEMADAVIEARAAGKQTAPVTSTFGSLELDEAYEVQAVLDGKASELLGPPAGYKVAYASKAAQKQFGVDEPARGTFFAIQRVPNNSKIRADEFRELLLETEIAFTIGKPITKPIEDLEELKKRVRWVHVAFDAGDFPFTTEPVKPTVVDLVAAGTGAHRFVLGPAVDPSSVDADALQMGLERNDRMRRISESKAVMGSPWLSLQWLVNDVVKRGGDLAPGDVVLTGTAAAAYRAKGDEIKGRYEGSAGPLGKVVLTIE